MEVQVSPDKKKLKYDKIFGSEHQESPKRKGIYDHGPSKRAKVDENKDTNSRIQAMKRKNFVTACERVSYKAYFDLHTRLNLVNLPSCMNGYSCKHHEYKKECPIKQVPLYAEESFKIEMRANMWLEALEVCQMAITSTHYLSSHMLKDIVEIILNANEDEYAGYTTKYLIDKCQQILSVNFNHHPPCLVKTLRKCYNEFLTSALDLKENTFTNRLEFGHTKGIVKYCMNRLEYELSIESPDGPLVDKYENIPEQMKQSVRGIHWQKEKFEIYELLNRNERINRLMVVLETILELLQADLAIWQSRYTNNLGSHIMRSHKPLMAYVLWSDNVLYTGAVNNNCRQLLRLFVYLVHLQYPEKYLRIMTSWLNTMIQTFYICETNSNSDYPNTGKYCNVFANEFYKIIAELPSRTILSIIDRIRPTYMQHIIGTIHLQKLLSTQESDVLKIFKNYVEGKMWMNFVTNENELHLPKYTYIQSKRVKNVTNYLTKKCSKWKSYSDKIDSYERFDSKNVETDTDAGTCVDQNYVTGLLHVTVVAYLDAYSVQHVQDTIDKLNERLNEDEKENNEEDIPFEFGSYSVTEHFIKKYRSIYQILQELMRILQDMKNNGDLPDFMKVFDGELM